jgi:hypothetical protein
MHSHTLDGWKHDHVFLGGAHDCNERRIWLDVGLTATMMVVEIADAPQPVEAYEARLADLHGPSHVTVEVLRCNGPH